MMSSMLRLRSSFRSKVAAVAWVTTILALVVGFSLFVIQQWGAERGRLVRERVTLAEVLAENLAASVVFGDRVAAETVLASLTQISSVRRAVVFDNAGEPFARLERSGASVPPVAQSVTTPDWRLHGGELEVRVPITIDSQREGELVLVTGLDELSAWLRGYLAVAAVAFAIATAVAVVIGLWLARLIIQPVSRLARAMDLVRHSGEFGAAVERTSDDEVGQLTDVFNDLIEELKRNDLSLRRALDDLTAARDHAEEASLQKSHFLANMSHEIRTPLNGVLGMVQAMQMHRLPKAQAQRLAVIRSSGEMLLTILNDILDVSKIEAGRLELEQVPFDLGQVVEAVRANFEPTAAHKGLRLETRLAPEARGPWLGDPTRTHQILTNLVSNAIKFTSEGQVTVEARAKPGGLTITVSDTGLGVPADKRSQLFQKFVQADSSTTRRFGGTGLGLAICQQLAILMGGGIRHEDGDGRGSRFVVELPLPAVTAEASQSEDHALGPAAARTDAPGRPLRVLAAEDNATNRMVLQALLEPADVELSLVEDGRQAVEAWRAATFDVILMDIQMPVMDGVEATRAIRREEVETGRPPIQILALSANAMDHQVRSYLVAGMNAHIAKPIQVAALYEALRAVEPLEAAA